MIAEGVETAEQMTFLRDNDCDEVQGYHFSKPVAADEIEGCWAVELQQIVASQRRFEKVAARPRGAFAAGVS